MVDLLVSIHGSFFLPFLVLLFVVFWYKLVVDDIFLYLFFIFELNDELFLILDYLNEVLFVISILVFLLLFFFVLLSFSIRNLRVRANEELIPKIKHLVGCETLSCHL
jgi:hypothetical protein